MALSWPGPPVERTPVDHGCSRSGVRTQAWSVNGPGCTKANERALPPPTEKACATLPAVYVAVPVHVASVLVTASAGVPSPVSHAVSPANGSTAVPRLTL